MRIPKGIIILIVVIMLAVAIFFIKAVIVRIPANIFCFLDIGTHRIPQEYIEVNESQVVGQSFIPNFSNLFKISVFLVNENVLPEGKLYFHLREKNAKKDLYFKELNLSEIRLQRNDFYIVPPEPHTKNGFHYHIRLPIINDSYLKDYYFYFESPGVPPGKGIKLGIWKTRYYEALRGGRAFINQQPADCFLAFRTFNTWQGKPSDVFRQIKARLSQDRKFSVFYFSSLAAILSGIIFAGLMEKRK